MTIYNQTLTGSLEETYGVAEIRFPDGTQMTLPVQRATTPEGREVIEFVQDKIAEFEARFADTTTIPSDWKIPESEILSPLPGHDPQALNRTRQDVQRALILALGDPEQITRQGGFSDRIAQHLKQHPSTASLLGMLAQTQGGEWASVIPFLRPLYQVVP
jgi:hypothetical protein